MKTTKLTDEQVQVIRAWAKAAKEYSERIDVVLNNIKKQLKKESGDNTAAKAIDKNWKLFKDGLFPAAMPHYRKNGSHAIIVCDWVEQKRDLNIAFTEYRYIKGEVREDETKIEGNCVGFIKRELDKPKKEVLTYESGFKKEVNALDENGDPIMEKVECELVPRAKTSWGYTDIVIDAFIEAADRLLAMLDDEEQVKAYNLVK